MFNLPQSPAGPRIGGQISGGLPVGPNAAPPGYSITGQTPAGSKIVQGPGGGKTVLGQGNTMLAGGGQAEGGTLSATPGYQQQLWQALQNQMQNAEMPYTPGAAPSLTGGQR